MPVSFKRRGFFKTIVSLIRMKLIIPMIRSKNPPEITARGSMVGMGWAMTPLVGIQMYLAFMTWLACRKFSNGILICPLQSPGLGLQTFLPFRRFITLFT